MHQSDISMSFSDRSNSLDVASRTQPTTSYHHSHSPSVLSTTRSFVLSSRPSSGPISRDLNAAAHPCTASLGDIRNPTTVPRPVQPLRLHPVAFTSLSPGACQLAGDACESPTSMMTGFTLHSSASYLASRPPTATPAAGEGHHAQKQCEDGPSTIEEIVDHEADVDSNEHLPRHPSPTSTSSVTSSSAATTSHPPSPTFAALSPLPPSFSPLTRADLERLCHLLHADALASHEIAHAAVHRADALDDKLGKLSVGVVRALKDAQRRERRDLKALQAKEQEADELRGRLGKVLGVLASVVPGLLECGRGQEERSG